MSNENFKHKPGLADDCPICQNEKTFELPTELQGSILDSYKNYLKTQPCEKEIAPKPAPEFQLIHKLPDPGNMSLASVQRLETQRKLYNAVVELQNIVEKMLQEKNK